MSFPSILLQPARFLVRILTELFVGDHKEFHRVGPVPVGKGAPRRAGKFRAKTTNNTNQQQVCCCLSLP